MSFSSQCYDILVIRLMIFLLTSHLLLTVLPDASDVQSVA